MNDPDGITLPPSSESGLAAMKGRADAGGTGAAIRCSPESDHPVENQLLSNADKVFGGGEAPPVDLKALHAKIGQQALEIDFLEHALGRVGDPSARR